MKYNNIVLPNYNHCVLSTMTSILNNFNVPSEHKSLESLDKILQEKRYKNVILFILDGMGEHILNNISENGYFNQNKIDCVTSVYPSTTTAALTSYYSGCTPYETGWIAWSQYFKEYGRALDMFSHNDSYYREPLRKPLKDLFATDMHYESVFDKIEKANSGTRSFDIGPEYAERRGLRKLVADNIDELILNVKDVCELSGEKFLDPNKNISDSYMNKDEIMEQKNKVKIEEIKSHKKDKNKKRKFC